ncbi:c-type cytochrome [Agarivorans aestuarii]|uniref:c-type cytochrome n=1 Tax=Agarivorans aestuarii TaxID=1563703 RepID=UPI001C81E9E1|nr:c-type cytochrome [Agarivorans aestuarii]
MKKLTLVLMLMAGVASPVWAKGDAAAGEQKAATCKACHNEQGEAAGYPKLEGQHAGYLLKQLKEFKAGAISGGTEGRNNAVMGGMAMPLSEQDMEDLAAYYSGQAMSPNTTAPEYVEAGQQLYMGGDLERGIAACTACHGPRGVGQSLAGFPRVSSQYAGYIKSQLEMFRSGERANDLNGMMQDVAAKLSDKDIEILSQYLGGLH